MRSQESSAANEISILDVVNEFLVRISPEYYGYRYGVELPPHLQDIYKKNKIPLSSPAVLQLFRSNYVESFIDSNIDTDVGWLYAGIEYKKEEDPYMFCSLSDLTQEYISLNIKSTFGLTLLEYLDLTTEEKDVLVKHASKVNKELADQLAKQQQQTEELAKTKGMLQQHKDAMSGINNVGINMSHLEDMFGI